MTAIAIFFGLIAAGMWSVLVVLVYNGKSPEAHTAAGWMLVVGTVVALVIAVGAAIAQEGKE